MSAKEQIISAQCGLHINVSPNYILINRDWMFKKNQKKKTTEIPFQSPEDQRN